MARCTDHCALAVEASVLAGRRDASLSRRRGVVGFCKLPSLRLAVFLVLVDVVGTFWDISGGTGGCGAVGSFAVEYADRMLREGGGVDPLREGEGDDWDKRC